ncbi:hypothetical protein LXL04_007437 [Taraxacum kok-saghyz]
MADMLNQLPPNPYRKKESHHLFAGYKAVRKVSYPNTYMSEGTSTCKKFSRSTPESGHFPATFHVATKILRMKLKQHFMAESLDRKRSKSELTSKSNIMAILLNNEWTVVVGQTKWPVEFTNC